MAETLSEFYTDKTIFLTGAAGFLGTFLLEVLLRCFPGITRIYILLRPKKGVDPFQRRDQMFKKKIFLETCKNNPEFLDKVHVIKGDISKPNLGMCDEDVRKICDEASIVFHGAASISFTRPYRSISLQNAKGTDYVLDLCRKFKKMDILVYTSTAYANCHIHPEKIEEKIYKLPYGASRFLDEMENGTDESYSELVSSLKHLWNLKWPNSYTFSKCLTENILLEKVSDLPVAIIRPSIVFSACKGIRPGYVDEGTGISNLSMGVGKGFVRVIHGDKDSIFDVIPIDVVANCHIVAAWCVATERRPSMFVVHCTSGDTMKLNFGKYMDDMCKLTEMYPLPNSFQTMSVSLIKNNIVYKILSLYRHYIPAAALDLYLSYKGSKLRLVKLYRFFDKMSDQLHYFMSTTFDFQATNLKNLSNDLPPEEMKLFYTDIRGISFKDVIENIPSGCDIFNWESDKLRQEKRLRLVKKRTMIVTFIKRFTLLLIILVLYFIISKLFV